MIASYKIETKQVINDDPSVQQLILDNIDKWVPLREGSNSYRHVDRVDYFFAWDKYIFMVFVHESNEGSRHRCLKCGSNYNVCKHMQDYTHILRVTFPQGTYGLSLSKDMIKVIKQ